MGKDSKQAKHKYSTRSKKKQRAEEEKRKKKYDESSDDSSDSDWESADQKDEAVVTHVVSALWPELGCAPRKST